MISLQPLASKIANDEHSRQNHGNRDNDDDDAKNRNQRRSIATTTSTVEFAITTSTVAAVATIATAIAIAIRAAIATDILTPARVAGAVAATERAGATAVATRPRWRRRAGEVAVQAAVVPIRRVAAALLGARLGLAFSREIPLSLLVVHEAFLVDEIDEEQEDDADGGEEDAEGAVVWPRGRVRIDEVLSPHFGRVGVGHAVHNRRKDVRNTDGNVLGVLLAGPADGGPDADGRDEHHDEHEPEQGQAPANGGADPTFLLRCGIEFLLEALDRVVLHAVRAREVVLGRDPALAPVVEAHAVHGAAAAGVEEGAVAGAASDALADPACRPGGRPLEIHEVDLRPAVAGRAEVLGDGINDVNAEWLHFLIDDDVGW